MYLSIYAPLPPTTHVYHKCTHMGGELSKRRGCFPPVDCSCFTQINSQMINNHKTTIDCQLEK